MLGVLECTGSYVREFLHPGVLKFRDFYSKKVSRFGGLHPGVLTFRRSYVQRFLRPRVLTFLSSYVQGFLCSRILTLWGS